MRKSSLSKKVLAIILAAALLIASVPTMYAFADFTSVNLLTGAGNKVDLSNSTPVYYDKYLTENVFASGYGLSASTVTGLVDGDKSTECLFNGRGTSSRWWNGVRYALTEACFAQKLVIYSGLPAYIDCYDVYASDSLETLYRVGNYMGKFTCSGDAVEIPLNKSVQYFAVIYDQITSDNESARPREVELWSGDETSAFVPVCLTDSANGELSEYKSLAVNPSTLATATYNINQTNLDYFLSNTTNSHKDVGQSGSNYTTFQFAFDTMYYIGDVCIDAGTWNCDETWDVYASNSLATLYTEGSKVATADCKYASGARITLNTYATYIALVQTTGYARIRAFRIYTADSTGVPMPFVSSNILRTDLDSVVPVVQYVENGNVSYENVITAEKLAFFTDGDTTTHKDLSDTLGWTPARKIGAEFTLNNPIYIGSILLYASLANYPESYSIYASDSLETLYTPEKRVANAAATNGTTINAEVNATVKYIAFFCESSTGGPRFKEIEAWSAEAPDPGTDPGETFTPVNVLRNNVTSSRCIQFYPTNHYVGDASQIDAETIAKLTDGDTATTSDCSTALDWDPPRYLGVEYALDSSYYIGELKIYSGYTTSVDTFDVYASDSFDTLYSDDNLVASGVNCDGTAAQTLAVNRNITYVAFLISGIELYCARIAEFEAWTADSSAVPAPFTSENVLLNNVTSSRCIQFYPSNYYVGDASRISEEDYAKFTDGDTSTKTDSYSALDWDPPRYIGIEYSLDNTYYIGNFKIYSGYSTSVDTFDVYASDSLDTLYNDANCVATGVDCDDTGAQTIAVNKNVRYVTFLISGVELYCARIAEFEAWTAEQSTAPVDDGITRVLTIGNSFAENASIYASEIAYANNQQMMFGYLKYPSCTLQRHWNDIQNNVAEFKFRVTNVTGQGTTVADGSSSFYTIQQAIDYADWDIVVFQQESSNARNYNTFSPYLQNLIDYVEGELPNARLLFHQVWRWGEWDADQFDLIKEASERMVKDYGLELIPSGLAFEYAREALGSATIINEDDGHYQHANRYGQYIEGCCYVAKIFDIEIAADTFASHPYVNDENFVATLTAAANNAVSYYNKAVGDADENGTIQGNDLTKIRKHLVYGAEIRKDIGDVTGNYEIDVYDYVHLKSYLLDTANVELR